MTLPGAWTAALSLIVSAPPATVFVEPRHELACTFAGVLEVMGQSPRPELPLPALRLQHRTPLSEFQDAVEPQWNLRPDVFLNAYAAARNEVFILTEADYYARLSRFVDDSIAHELAHYVQVRYRNIPIEHLDDSLEAEAIHVQTEFRERFLKTGVSPCAPR
ncbi:MAG: hypothetical protein HY553_20090 [Elusimicrobia bacterium]|nr:hypothetical protein [Elusimicrobiota bacterium]